jgi:hypothetical protein
VSTAARAQRCVECDGVQPIDAVRCEVCGAPLDGSLAFDTETPGGRRFERAAPKGRIIKAAKPAATPTSSAAPSPPLTPPAFAKTPTPSSAVRISKPPPKRGADTAKPSAPAWSFQPRLGATLIAGACVAAGAVVAGASLTFRLPNADSGAVLRSTIEALWPWMLAAVIVGWALTVASDYLAARVSGVARAPRPGGLWSLALPCLAGAGCVLSATRTSRQSYVPPATWPLILAVAVAAYAVAALLHVATVPRRGRTRIGPWRLATAIAASATVAAAWLAPSAYEGPSAAHLAMDAGALSAVVPMHGCKSISVEANPVPIMRDLVRASLLCKQGNLSGRFVWFRTSGMMHVYASARERESNIAFTGEACTSGSAFVGDWHEDSDPSTALGQLMCIPGAHSGVIAWENDRVNLYSIIRAPDPIKQLYNWWHVHSSITPS